MGWRVVLAQRTPPMRAATKRRSQAGVEVRRGAATRSLRSARGAAHSEAAAAAGSDRTDWRRRGVAVAIDVEQL
jgi:hypothetical protein